MIDHVQRIRQRQIDALKKSNEALENAEMERMDKSAQPLMLVLIVCLVAIAVDSVLDIYASKKYASEIKTANAFAQCLNGTPIQVGDSWARCGVEKLSLVAGMK